MCYSYKCNGESRDWRNFSVFQSCYIWFLHISDEKRCRYFQLIRRSRLKMMLFFLLELDVQNFFLIITLISAPWKKLNPEKAGRGSTWSPPVVFPNMYLLERGGFLWLLILSELISFLKISLKFLKSLRRYDQTHSQPEKNYSQKAHLY